MHSTLQAELRHTRKVLDRVRPYATKPFINTPRTFSNRALKRNGIKPGRFLTHARLYGSDDGKKPASAPSPDSKPSKLSTEIEKWINHLSQTGRPLDVWDTISEQDEKGTWRLSSQARQDLEDVDKWAKETSTATTSPFGIKVADGRIRALSTQELHQEQQNGISSGLVHGPLISPSATKDPRHDVSSRDHVRTDVGELRVEPNATAGQRDENDKFITELDGNPTLDIPKFHGSAAARRQRAQRPKEKTTNFVLPAWFSSQNVVTRGSGRLALPASSHVEKINAVSHINGTNEAVTSDLLALSDGKASRSEQFRYKMPPNSPDDDPHIQATGGDQEPSSDSPDRAGGSGGPPKVSSTLVSLLSSAGSYCIQEAQHNELLATAKGRLRSPASGSLDNRPGGIRGHLIIHFTAANGEILLDHLVEDMATRLNCNLITLDAQDISSLIVKAEVDSLVKHEAANLGYEVYGDIYRGDATEQDAASTMPGEDADDIEDDLGNPNAQGMPFVVGKPITIDLKALFSSKPHRRPSGFRQSNMMPDVFGPSPGAKSGPPLFASIVESILSSIRTRSKLSPEEASQDDEQQSTPLAKDPTIVHVKDWRSIQDTNVGKQFLMQLYEQVERRRASGESIMLVGTECSKDGQTSYDQSKINNLQSSDQEEISSTIVITPTEAANSDDPNADRAKRLRIINSRHLWQMLQSKNIALASLQPNSWNDASAEAIHPADKSYLEKSLWSFGFVQRLASILASSDPANSLHPIAEAAAVIEISDNSKYIWAKQARKDTTSSDARRSGSDKADLIRKIREKANKHEKKLLSGVIEPKKIDTTFHDIHIPPETIEALKTLTTLSLIRPDAFKYGVLASDRIPGLLLYGPPGTGKTLAAKAVARESGATMLEVSSADISDMYVGEGEKNVKALFSLAKKLSPCVVFLDEADAMFSARASQGRRVSHRELLNQFLREWDGMSNDSGSAFIMVATNRPMDLDDAVLRRLPRRLLIDLPTETDRLDILKIHLRFEELASDVNLSHIAAKTPFYSGSDLKNLAVSAALNAVREETANARSGTNSKRPKYPSKRRLKAHHFESALEEISASISEDMSSLRDIKKFDEQYGDKRGKKRKSPKWGFKTSAEADAVLDTIKVRS